MLRNGGNVITIGGVCNNRYNNVVQLEGHVSKGLAN